MSGESTLWENFAKLAREVDWPRAIHRGATLVRALRGDGPQLDAEHARETARASQVRSTIEDIARKAVGCTRAPDCTCPVCIEQGPVNP